MNDLCTFSNQHLLVPFIHFCIFIHVIVAMVTEEVLKLMVFEVDRSYAENSDPGSLASLDISSSSWIHCFYKSIFKTRPSKMDIYHRFCVIVSSLIQKQTNRIWELHYTLKITKPWNDLDHLAFTCLIAMVGTSTGHSILIVLWSPLAETATYIAYTQFWWQWQCNGDLPPNLLGARPIQESATPSNVHPPPSPALPALLAPFILFFVLHNIEEN